MSKVRAIIYAVLAAIFYAINIPVSKILLSYIEPTTMAALLYLGAGIGMAILSVVVKREEEEKLDGKDFPFVLGMIVLDVVAPIFLMLGLSYGTSANSSLLGNFEIVATSLIALLIFKEKVNGRLWGAIALITLSSITLSLEGEGSFSFSYGSIFVILATLCWGLENNCTRNISSKDTYQIVTLKGIFSGLGAVGIALVKGETMPGLMYAGAALVLGFASYGLSIFLYVKAQSVIGAAKTSAYYAVAPFIGAFLSFVLLREKLTEIYLISFFIMVAGTTIVVLDTLVNSHEHEHTHTYTHRHNGVIHTHTVVHSHRHDHYGSESKHGHHHSRKELERYHMAHADL